MRSSESTKPCAVESVGSLINFGFWATGATISLVVYLTF